MRRPGSRLPGRAGPVQEFGDGTDGHGDVVLDADAFALLGFGDVLAQVPQGGGLGLAGGDGAIENGAVGDGGGEFGLKHGGKVVADDGVAELDSTYQGWAWGSGSRVPGMCCRTRSRDGRLMSSKAVTRSPPRCAGGRAARPRRPARPRRARR
jgi:hypothetical protein